MALCDLPAEDGVDHPNAPLMFPEDAIARARAMRASIGEGGSGSYTNSQGIIDFRCAFFVLCFFRVYWWWWWWWW